MKKMKTKIYNEKEVKELLFKFKFHVKDHVFANQLDEEQIEIEFDDDFDEDAWFEENKK